MSVVNLFAEVQSRLGGEENRRGWYDVPCPQCGKEPKRGQVHFGYREQGGRCWVCGWGGGLRELAELLDMDSSDYVPPVRDAVIKEVARWRMNPWALLAKYKDHPQRADRWAGYKPLTVETLDRHGFGLGRLPFQHPDDSWYMSKSDWLIVPVYEDGALVALRGRNLTDRGPKWISATGSQYALWNVDNVPAGSICWVCENYVDAAWTMQAHPEWSAVAIGGATTWKREWAARLADRSPAQVIVALDNDLTGNGGGKRREAWEADWKQDHPGLNPPIANGPKIVSDLQATGLAVRLFEWPENAPQKAGVDWALDNGND